MARFLEQKMANPEQFNRYLEQLPGMDLPFDLLEPPGRSRSGGRRRKRKKSKRKRRR
jgi:hypothetical protein